MGFLLVLLPTLQSLRVGFFVPSTGQFCFQKFLYEDEPLQLTVSHWKPANSSFKVAVRSEYGRLLIEKQSSEFKLSAFAPNQGEYEICISSGLGQDLRLGVEFRSGLSLHDPDDLPSPSDGAVLKETLAFLISQIKQAGLFLHSGDLFMEMRMQIEERVGSTVLWVSLVLIALLVLSAWSQFKYLRDLLRLRKMI